MYYKLLEPYEEGIHHVRHHVSSMMRDESLEHLLSDSLNDDNLYQHAGQHLGQMGLAFDIGSLFTRGALAARFAALGTGFNVASIATYGLGFWASLYVPFAASPLPDPIDHEKMKKQPDFTQIVKFYLIGKATEVIIAQYKKNGTFQDAYHELDEYFGLSNSF